MSGIITFGCRACAHEIRFAPANVNEVTCSYCQKNVPVRVERSLLESGVVCRCVSCGHDTLYVQKDFNRSLGLALVVAGVAVSIFFFARGQSLYAMLALGAMAIVDYLIYSLVDAVTVCYACHAIYRGFRKNPEHEAFDLKNLEKYGGREPRF